MSTFAQCGRYPSAARELLPINFLVDQEVVHRRHSPSCIDLYSDWPILILICCNETFDAETDRFADVIDPQKVSSDTMKCPAHLIGPAVMYRTLGSPINSGSSGRSRDQPHPLQHLSYRSTCAIGDGRARVHCLHRLCMNASIFL